MRWIPGTRRQKTSRKFGITIRSLYSRARRPRVCAKARHDPSHALPGTERGLGVLLKSRYSRRSFMLTGRKLALTLAFTVLVGLTFGVSCRGFFPKPILQSIAINPTAPQVNADKTLNLQLFGTYDDGSRSPVKSGVGWSIVPTSVATSV